MTELNVVKRLREIQKSLEELALKQVVVGAIGGDVSEDGLTNADLLAIHEFGSIPQNIPERSVMRSTLARIIGNTESLLSTKVRDCLSGNISSDETYSHVGIYIKNEVLETFDSNSWKPLDDKTIKRKGSSKPLIDTDALRGSISYEVRNRE